MTIVTGRQFRANQGKYIGLAHRGERVIVSSRSGYAELTPVSVEDKEIEEYRKAVALLAVSSKIGKEAAKGELLRFDTVEDLRKHLASL